jgi:PPOX class probable F420-dependent enzyme
MPGDLDQAKYISFTTFRSDGTPVPTAVWVVPFDGGYAFTTGADSHKVKRLRADRRVEVCVCNVRGAVADGTLIHPGTAAVLDEADSRRVSDLIRSKYRFEWIIGIAPMNLLRRLRGTPQSSIGIRIDVAD